MFHLNSKIRFIFVQYYKYIPTYSNLNNKLDERRKLSSGYEKLYSRELPHVKFDKCQTIVEVFILISINLLIRVQ